MTIGTIYLSCEANPFEPQEKRYGNMSRLLLGSFLYRKHCGFVSSRIPSKLLHNSRNSKCFNFGYRNLLLSYGKRESLSSSASVGQKSFKCDSRRNIVSLQCNDSSAC